MSGAGSVYRGRGVVQGQRGGADGVVEGPRFVDVLRLLSDMPQEVQDAVWRMERASAMLAATTVLLEHRLSKDAKEHVSSIIFNALLLWLRSNYEIATMAARATSVTGATSTTSAEPDWTSDVILVPALVAAHRLLGSPQDLNKVLDQCLKDTGVPRSPEFLLGFG